MWRSVLDDHVGYVFAAFVIADEPNVIALQQPAGSPILRRGGTRAGPNGRSMTPGGWDGTHRLDSFNGGDVVRAHTPGSPYSVIRRITPDGYRGWYINLELPWSRTPIGYDTRDLTLDIVFDDHLTQPQWKDGDEHDWNLATGAITADQHRLYRAHGHTAIADALFRRGLFGTDWSHLHPIEHNALPHLPATATALHPSPTDRPWTANDLAHSAPLPSTPW